MVSGGTYNCTVYKLNRVISKLNSVIGKLNRVINKLNSVISELNVAIEALTAFLERSDEVGFGPVLVGELRRHDVALSRVDGRSVVLALFDHFTVYFNLVINHQ